MRNAKGFTLVEILIVVVLLGVLAAIVIPAVANCSTSARETTLAANLNLLRRFVMVYTSQHKEVAPGYLDGNTSAAATDAAFRNQALLSSNTQGQTAARGTSGYTWGPYLSKMPANPFNGLDTVEMLGVGEAFPATADGSHGWICQPQSGEIRPDNTGSDLFGKAYYDY
jgi:prepilin-type N-terminal cleavage/methylation domain-containing protein